MRIGQKIIQGKYSSEEMKEKLATFGALSMMLGLAVEAAENGEKQESWKIMHNVSNIGHQLECEEFNSLYSGVGSYIAFLSKRNEFYYQELFKGNISKIIPKFKTIEKKDK